jgi:hypothetical protein
MLERTHFEREISTLRRDPGPQRNYDISARVARPPTLGFEFDVHYGFVSEVVAADGKVMPADGAEVTTHTWATDFFKVKRDGPRLEIATKPFTTDTAGEKELDQCVANVKQFTALLLKRCSKAKAKPIAVAGVTGQPRPFALANATVAGMPIVKLPFGGKFDADCRVWAAPQATLTLPIWKVAALVKTIKESERDGVGLALTGRKGQRMGVQSEAIYRALAAVTAVKAQLIADKTPVKALKNQPLTSQTFSDRLSGFLILLASYLITSELPYRFEPSAPRLLRDYEPFAKAYLPLNVKTPFPDVFAELLFPEDQAIFREMFADGPARVRLFSLAKPGATLADGARKLFPPGPLELGADSVYTRQQAEFGSVPTWDDLVEHTLASSHKGWGARLLVPISHVIAIDKTYPRLAVEMRRIGFASVFDDKWPGLTKRVLRVARSLG